MTATDTPLAAWANWLDRETDDDDEGTMGAMFQKFGPVDDWMLSVDEIERIIVEESCRHLLPSIDACEECFVPALMRRQMALLAELLGCTPEDAAAVGDRLTREHLEQRGAADAGEGQS